MAAEYSRELAVKISAGQKLLADDGFHVGGAAGYGLRRMLISSNGRRRQLLRNGECKNLKSDHTILALGPKREVDCVRTIFALAADKKNSPHTIAQELNHRGLRYFGNKHWDYTRLYRILKSEKYTGSNVWGRNLCLLGNRPKRVPRSAWIVKPHAFPATVSSEQFALANKQIGRRRCNPGKPGKYYLARLAKCLAQGGKTPTEARNKGRSLTVHLCRHHFGSIFHAYELIGYKPISHVVNSHNAALKNEFVEGGLIRSIENALRIPNEDGAHLGREALPYA